MKKIIASIFASAIMLTSCDMDTPAPGVLDDQTAINDIERAYQFRNYIYNNLRSCTAGGWVYYTELQMDQYIGLSTNGNRGGTISSGEITTSADFASGTYNGMYSRIANANYLIEQCQKLIDSGEYTDEDKIELEFYIGEAKFARAYYYFYLMDHFCQTYDASKGDEEGLGLSLVTVYDPTPDHARYPGRSTMNQVIERINTDLDDAYTAFKNFEDEGYTMFLAAGSNYLSTSAAEALQARVALVTGDYETAISKAKSVIANPNYQLAEGYDYVDMWEDQNVSELIFAPYVDSSESSTISSTCEGWNYWWSKATQTDHLPTYTTLAMYDQDSDYRFEAFFKVYYVNVQGGRQVAYVMNKYPGNKSLNSSGTDLYLNTPKPFRLSEQYLIIAEAAAETNQPSLACEYLNKLRAARIDAAYYEDINLSGDELIQFVRDERSRELLGEGFRQSDLRRWKQAWKRYSQYPINPVVAQSFVIADINCQYSADDYRYVWPIPADEMEINPQLTGQQNPGY